MSTRIIAALLGLAAATSVASAQVQQSKPDQRIRVSKGEVVLPPKVDTLYITRYDTVTKFDTLRVPYTVTRVRVDTVVKTETIAPAPLALGPLYLAFYTGPTMPSGNIDRLYTTAFHGGAMIGWEDEDFLPIGGRLSVAYTQLSRENGALRAVVGTTTPMIVSFAGDLKLLVPGIERFRLYGVGGASFNMYKGLATVAESGHGMTNVDGQGGWYEAVDGSNWQNKFGFHAGGGADFMIGSQTLFLEARAVAIQANGARTWFVPVSLGVRFF
jgi:hypothetical protein